MRANRLESWSFANCWKPVRGWSTALLMTALLSSAPVFAQSAADKATARELASEGIRLFESGDMSAALDRLQKAQALYDAPIHLLYIARTQVKLGQLVEGAETYRTLGRVQLAENAPNVFVDAQRDGNQELEALEPRLSRLTVEVTPFDVDGMSVTIDGKPINIAVLGVPRASNPGKHTVVVEAPGYETATADVKVREGKAAKVEIELKALPEGAVAAENGESAGEGDEKAGDDSWETGSMGLIAGVKLGGVLPLGELERGTPMRDYFEGGAGGRVDVGFRFVKYLGVKAYLSGAVFVPGNEIEDYAEEFPEDIDSLLVSSMGEVGLALLFTSNPRKLGAFGELGLGLVRGYGWWHSYNRGECRSRATYGGWAGHLGGGVNVPLSRLFTLVPTLDVSLGQLNSRSSEYGCTGVVAALPDKTEQELDQALHVQIFLGIGGDFHFGDDWFR